MKTARVVIYCRESRDEGGALRERIETQRDMLLEYAHLHRLGEVTRVIMDDDMTGTDFRRLETVREMARRGEIDVLLLKDSSRLGRNLTESLLFTEFLAETGVRLVFESEEYNEDIFPLEAWFHEMRAKEDSRKIRRVLYHKMETGEFLVAAPYGYRREGAALWPEEETAPVVKSIFRSFREGLSTGAIARALTREGIPSPAVQKGRKGAEAAWSAATIRRILSDESYLGRRVMKKTVGRSFKDKTRRVTPEEERIIIENDHVPLVSGEVFRECAARLARGARGSGGKTPYGGLIFCGGCGERLVYVQKKGRSPQFVCAKYHKFGKNACTAHRIMPEAAECAVRGAAYGAFVLTADSPPPQPYPIETLYEDLAAGRITRAFFDRMRSLAVLPPAPETRIFPEGREEELAPLLIRRMVVYEKGEKNHAHATLEVETRF